MMAMIAPWCLVRALHLDAYEQSEMKMKYLLLGSHLPSAERDLVMFFCSKCTAFAGITDKLPLKLWQVTGFSPNKLSFVFSHISPLMSSNLY